MPFFSRRADYDRTRILAAAERARSQGKCRKAITLFRRVLAVESRDAELHWKLAPLLAKSGQHFDAWQSFRIAARDLIRQKRAEQALASYREATRCLPLEVEAWRATARLEIKLGRSRDALDTWLAARRAFKRRRHRAQAIAMLRAAREIEPWNLEIVCDLAQLLAHTHQSPEALGLLEELADECVGRELRRVRGVEWRIARTLSHTWLWLQAALRTSSEPASGRHAARASNVVPLSRSRFSRA